jgi:hypothetical protein
VRWNILTTGTIRHEFGCVLVAEQIARGLRGEMLMSGDGLERRIALLRKAIEARHSSTEREYRSGAVKFSDAIVELMAYLGREKTNGEATESSPGATADEASFVEEREVDSGRPKGVKSE